jgi:hypothetical protein
MPELLTTGQFGTTAQNDRVQAVMAAHNRKGRRPLTPYEAQQLSDGDLNPIYLYNVSPIHKWEKFQGQLGTIVINPRDWKAQVSVPAVIKGAIVRWVKSGLGMDQPFIEGGMEVAQDICGVAGGVEIHASAKLTNYGVFISRKPFDAEYLPEAKRRTLNQADKATAPRLLEEYLVPKHEQKKLIQEATEKLLGDLQSRILEADNWHMAGGNERKFIGAWHRECLKAFNHITGRKESKPWASIMVEDQLESCPFCGQMNKPNLAKCPKCLEIINPAAYAALKKEMGVGA